jgi:serine-type D-Ala-D-Ala carboxypeptidase (penicillin-binding protein 5/6)
MKKNDWFFTFLLLFLVSSIFFGFEETVFAKKDNAFFISLNEESLFRPLKKRPVILEVNAASYMSVLIDGNKDKVLLEKNVNELRYIASITKLMTAIIVIDNYNLEDDIIVSEKAVSTYSTIGELKVGEVFSVKDLLYMMLIESSNDAAEALSEKIGRNNFVSLMNKKALEINMKNTQFFNPSGLDFEGEEGNPSSVNDLKKLTIHIINNYPLIYEILSMPEIDMYYMGKFHHKLENTNILLKEDTSYLWGKTGYTVKAGECIVLVMGVPFSNNENSYIINIIMNAPDRFREARIMEQWIKESFYW